MNETEKLHARVRKYMGAHKETLRSMAPKLGFSTHAGLHQWLKKRHSVDLEIYHAMAAIEGIEGPSPTEGIEGLE